MSSRLPQDYAQYAESERIVEERKRREEQRRYEEEQKRYEAEAEAYNKQTDLPEEPGVINVVVREKDTKKLVAVYSKTGIREYIPESIQIRYSGATAEQIAEAKKNPNFTGYNPDPTKYTTEEISIPQKEQFGVAPNIEWWGVKEGDKEGQIKAYQNYIESERASAKEKIQAQPSNQTAVVRHLGQVERDFGAKIEYLRNPPATYEQSMEIYKSKIESVEQEAKGVRGDFVYHGVDFSRYNKLMETRTEAAKGTQTYGGKDQSTIDWSRLSKEELATELKNQQTRSDSQKTLTPPEIWKQTREYAQARAAGFSSTGITLVDEAGKPIQSPRGLTRQEQTAYNMGIIGTQIPAVKEKYGIKEKMPTDIGIPKTTTEPIIERTGKGTYADPFKGKQPDRSRVSPYLGATYWTAPGTDKTFTTLSDAEAYLRKPATMQWTVGDKTFKSKESAEKYIQRTSKTESSYIGFSPEGKPIQGAVQPLWTVDNLNPITKERFPTKTFKTEAEAIAYQKKFGKEETFTGLVGNDFFVENKYVATKPSLITTAMTPKQTWLGAEIEREYNVVSKEAEELQKKDPLKAVLFGIPYATQRSVLGTMAFGVNYAEQVYAPFLAEKVGIKVERPAPISLNSDASGMAVLPYQFEKGRFDYSSKEWASRQAQYIKKYGVVEYGAGLVFDFGGLTGVPKAILLGSVKVGSKIVSPLLPRIGQAAKSAAILQPTKKIGYQPTTRANEIDYTDFGERIGKTSLIKSKPIAARQSDVRPFTPKRTLPIKEEKYTPPLRANEIPQREGIIPKENIKGEIKFSKGFIPNKVEPPLKGKIIEPVQPDRTYSPSRRANEIDLIGGGEIIGRFSNIKSKPVAARQSDVRPFTPKRTLPIKEELEYKPRGRYEGGFKDILKSDDVIPKELRLFKKTEINLGKAQPESKKTVIKGKEEKPIEEDFFYKPSKRANEIDLTDAADSPKAILKEELKSEIPLDLKRELKRIKKKEQPVFKSEKISFEGEGKYIAGKSGKQELMQIQKQEELTKKKLISKRQTPAPIDWTEKIETAKLPTGGKAPVQMLVPPRPKEQKKKVVSQPAYSSYEIPLHSDRPQISARSMTGSSLSLGIRSALTSRVGTRSIEGYKQVQPQTIKQSERLSTKAGTKLSTKTEQKLFNIQAIKSSQKLSTPQKQSPKLAERTLTKTPTPQKPRATQKPIFRQKQPTRLALRTPEPMRPKKRIVAILPPIDLKPKKKAVKQKKNRTVDFLGNTRLDKIEGFFKRSEIITGDVASAKQLKKDIRYKEPKINGLGFSGKKLKL